MATAKRPKTEQDKYRADIVRRMKAVGTYRKEFIPTVERLAALYVQREAIEKQFKESGGNAVVLHTNKAGATNAAKNPFLTARDEVYTQLLSHERELGLTPAGLKKLNEAVLHPRKQASGFAAALEQALNGAGD